MNSLTLSGHDLIPPSNWRTMLPDIRFLMDSFYSFIWIHFPTAFWPPWFFNEKSAYNYTEDPLFVIFSSPYSFMILYLGFSKFDYVSWCGSLSSSYLEWMLICMLSIQNFWHFQPFFLFFNVSNFLIYKKMQQILKWHKI